MANDEAATGDNWHLAPRSLPVALTPQPSAGPNPRPTRRKLAFYAEGVCIEPMPPVAPAVRFVSEAIKPVASTVDTRPMVAGSPGLPQQFTWRDEVITIARVERAWRETGPCRHGGGEIYARKHWFEVTTSTGASAKIYFERAARGRQRPERWWLQGGPRISPSTPRTAVLQPACRHRRQPRETGETT